MGSRTINLNKLTKSELIKIIQVYQYNIDVLNTLVHEISDVNLQDVSNWFEYIERDLEDLMTRGYISVNPFHNGLTQDDIKNGYEQKTLELSKNEN